MNKEISSKELEMLSDYLDGQLTGKVHLAFEAHLQSDPELLKELEGFKHTRLLLQQLSRKRAPRNFFVTPEMLPKPRPVHLFPVFRLASALAGIFLVVAFAGDLLFGTAPQSTVAGLAPLAMQSESRTSNSSSYQNSPLIRWVKPTEESLSQGILSGLGGGYGGGPASTTDNQLNTAIPDTPGPVGTEILPPPPSDTPSPASTEGLPTEPSLKAVESPTIEDLPLVSNPSDLNLTGGTVQDQYQSGPILGINPIEGAKDSSALKSRASPKLDIPRSTIHVIEGILGLVTVLAGLGAFLFYRRENL